MKRRKSVGIFGGSFNPPHLGHLLAAVYALKVFQLDEVWFVPAFQHAFEKKLAPFSVRLAMCRHLLAGLGPNFRISTIERDLKSSGKTLETLMVLQKRHPSCRFSLVIGSDTLKETRRWYRFSEIKKRFGIHVVPRGSSAKNRFAIPNISSSMIRNYLIQQRPLDHLMPPRVAKFLKSKVSHHSFK